MTSSAPESVTRTVRTTVQAIEAKLVSGNVPLEGLDDFKAAIDDARLRLWAVIGAVGATEPHEVLLRFRLRRALEICRSVIGDLESSAPGAHQRDLLRLRETAIALVRQLDLSIRGAS